VNPFVVVHPTHILVHPRVHRAHRLKSAGLDEAQSFLGYISLTKTCFQTIFPLFSRAVTNATSKIPRTLNSAKKFLKIPKCVVVQHEIGVQMIMINVKNRTNYDLQTKLK